MRDEAERRAAAGSMLMADEMAWALVAVPSVVLLRRVTRCEGLYEEPSIDGLLCEREYEFRDGRLPDTEVRCGVSCWALDKHDCGPAVPSDPYIPLRQSL